VASFMQRLEEMGTVLEVYVGDAVAATGEDLRNLG
jgi:hypothetical protein